MMIMIRMIRNDKNCYSIKLYHGHDDNDKNCYSIKLYHGHDDNDKKW